MINGRVRDPGCALSTLNIQDNSELASLNSGFPMALFIIRNAAFRNTRSPLVIRIVFTTSFSVDLGSTGVSLAGLIMLSPHEFI